MTKREILDAVKDEFIQSYGTLNCELKHLSGYVVLGIVSAALDAAEKNKKAQFLSKNCDNFNAHECDCVGEFCQDSH